MKDLFHSRWINFFPFPPTAEDGCQVNNGGCQHQCIPYAYGNFACQCHAGFRLATDGRMCKGMNRSDMGGLLLPLSVPGWFYRKLKLILWFAQMLYFLFLTYTSWEQHTVCT